MKQSEKRKLPVYQVSSEYANSLEHAFGLRGDGGPGAASEGAAAPLKPVNLGAILGAKGNTPLESSPFGHISEDTVHLSVWAEWGVEREALFQRLHKCQLEARGKAEQLEPVEETEAAGELDFDPDQIVFQDDSASAALGGERYIEGHGQGWFEFGNQLWRVRAHGIGGRDGRSYYPYAIQAGGILIGFRRDRHETVSNMWVEMGSIPLAQYNGLVGVWDMLLEIFKKEGIHIEKDIVSRVDVYTDFSDIDVSEFCDRFQKNHRVTRARKIGMYEEEMNVATYLVGMRQTGFSIGTHIKLRVYDKRYELKNDPIKWGIFAQKYGRIPDVLTRVEFQLRRVALKEFLYEGPKRLAKSSEGLKRIEGVSSYLEARDHLWLYLTEDWFRLTEDEVDAKNNHQGRAKTWSVWEGIQKAVTGVVKEIVRFARPPKINMEALYRQTMGCLCKMAVFEGLELELDTAGAVLRYFFNKVRDHGAVDFWRIMERHLEEKHNRLGFAPVLNT